MPDIETIWGERGTEALVLAPLGALYALGWWTYQAVYGLGLKRAAAPHRQLLTVGNLVAGGSGKTPTTLEVARLLRSLGADPVLGMSGYGSPRAEGAQVAPDGELNALEWGDEVAMVRLMLPTSSIIVGRDRVAAARLMHDKWPDRVLVMDDGFQHLRLEQPATLVLDAAPVNSFCMPAGPYREPRSTGLRRADLTVPNPELQLVAGPSVVRLATNLGETAPKGNVCLLCALARPHRVVRSLEREGFSVDHAVFLPDHDPLQRGTLLDEFDPAVPLVVTAKDWVKLRERRDLGARTVYVCWYETRFDPEERMLEWLKARLDEFAH